MKIIICGSITAAKEILKIKDALEKIGHAVEIPEGVKNSYFHSRTENEPSEKAEDKIKFDLIKGYYKKIKDYDALLVVNPEKRGIKDYIGGNTLIEMAFGHVLGKKIYVLNGLPQISYLSEIMAMQPILLNGDVLKIK